MRETFDAIGFRNVFAACALGHGQSLNRLATAFQMCLGDIVGSGRRVDHNAALMVALGDLEERLAQPLMEFDVEFLEAG